MVGSRKKIWEMMGRFMTRRSYSWRWVGTAANPKPPGSDGRGHGGVRMCVCGRQPAVKKGVAGEHIHWMAM